MEYQNIPAQGCVEVHGHVWTCSEGHIAVQYVLSATGLSLRPILIGLTQWGDACLGQGEAPPISFTKAGSKSAIRAAFVDVEGREVRPDQIRPVLRG